MAMMEDYLSQEPARRIDAAKGVDDQIGDAGALRMVGPGREKVEAEAHKKATTRVVFTISVEHGAPSATLCVDGPATGFHALAALSVFLEAMTDCKNISVNCGGPWPPGLAAAREELRGLARLVRIDMTSYRRDIAR